MTDCLWKPYWYFDPNLKACIKTCTPVSWGTNYESANACSTGNVELIVVSNETSTSSSYSIKGNRFGPFVGSDPDYEEKTLPSQANATREASLGFGNYQDAVIGGIETTTTYYNNGGQSYPFYWTVGSTDLEPYESYIYSSPILVDGKKVGTVSKGRSHSKYVASRGRPSQDPDNGFFWWWPTSSKSESSINVSLKTIPAPIRELDNTKTFKIMSANVTSGGEAKLLKQINSTDSYEVVISQIDKQPFPLIKGGIDKNDRSKYRKALDYAIEDNAFVETAYTYSELIEIREKDPLANYKNSWNVGADNEGMPCAQNFPLDVRLIKNKYYLINWNQIVKIPVYGSISLSQAIFLSDVQAKIQECIVDEQCQIKSTKDIKVRLKKIKLPPGTLPESVNILHTDIFF